MFDTASSTESPVFHCLFATMRLCTDVRLQLAVRSCYTDSVLQTFAIPRRVVVQAWKQEVVCRRIPGVEYG